MRTLQSGPPICPTAPPAPNDQTAENGAAGTHGSETMKSTIRLAASAASLNRAAKTLREPRRIVLPPAMPMIPRGKLVSSTFEAGAVLGVRLLAQAGSLIVLARTLGPAAFGAFAALSALAVLLGSLSTFGSTLALLRAVSSSDPDTQRATQLAWSSILSLGMALLGAYWILCGIIHIGAGVPGLAVLAIGVTEVLLIPTLQIPSAFRQGSGAIAQSQWIVTSPLLLRFGVAAVVSYTNVVQPLLAYAIGYLAVTSLLVMAVVAATPHVKPRPSTWGGLLARAPLCELSGFAALNLTALGPNEVDKVLATHVLQPGESGIYAASARVAHAMVLPVIALLMAALPRLFRDGKTLQGTKLQRAIFLAALGYGLFGSIALWIAAPVLPLVFGAAYLPLVPMARWLSPIVLGSSLRIAAGYILMTVNQPWRRAGVEILGLLLLAALAWPMTSLLGRIGMPLSVTAAEYVMAAAAWLSVYFSKRSRASN